MRNAWRTPAQILHRRRGAAHELIVVVGIENIVLTIVLALGDKIDGSKPLGKVAPRSLALNATPIGIAAPVEIDVGEIATMVPAALVDQRAQARAIGSRL